MSNTMENADVTKLSPIVVLETEDGLRLVEYERGEWEKAHVDATRMVTETGGRVLVAAVVRQCGDFAFMQKHGRM